MVLVSRMPVMCSTYPQRDVTSHTFVKAIFAKDAEGSRKSALSQTEKIYDFTTEVLNKAEQEGIHPQKAAIRQAEQRIAALGKVKSTY